MIVSTRGFDVFADPTAGVANLARALRGGGRLAFVSFDDPERAGSVLARAGFVDVELGAPGVVTRAAV